MFTIQHHHLEKLCEVHSYPVPSDGMIFFGIRGCLPVDVFNHDFLAQQSLNLTTVDFTSPRCTLGQWLPSKQMLAVFPGSTSPHKSYTSAGATSANQLMTGYYNDYRKGTHKAGKPTGHLAFRQTKGCPVRRDHNQDMNYDELDDRVEYNFPLDNLHAGWCSGISDTSHASAGCQVIVGYPQCEKRGSEPDAGPWQVFRTNAYELPQDRFPYVLSEGQNIQEVAQKMEAGIKIPARLRFGSDGPLVTELQKALQTKGFYEGEVDTDFGNRTLRAVLAFQESAFGKDQDNGIVGLVAAEALGLKSVWPEF
ncbi:MAG: peptidoglycan-binding protein [Pyrinomonadaceae bacterium]|nr:peptidoglycan-binding protein [Pyrinomonadaceae bacterium]